MAIEYKGQSYNPMICVLIFDWEDQEITSVKFFTEGSRHYKMEDRAADYIREKRADLKVAGLENVMSVHKIMNVDLRRLKTARVMVDWI